MAKLSAIKSDSVKESQGVWERYPGTDIEVLIARLGNPAYDEHARKLRKTSRIKSAGEGGLSERESKDLLAPAVAQSIILGWKNVQDDNGQDMPYSVANAVALLKDPALHDFYDWVLRVASDSERFRQEAIGEIVGN